jgi:hypothetical protein
MSRKHFEALADQIKWIDNKEARLAAAIAVCKAVKQFNSKFDQSKFLDACEV